MSTHHSRTSFKNILLTSCGLHPQIITEIIYALSQQNPPVVLHEVHVVTTEVGLEQIKTYLLDENDGYFHKLCREYGLNDTHFKLDNIQLLENAMGVSLDDIQTVGENEIVANTLTETMRQLTADPNTALYVSLAGGRRTISYYLGYALSLFGRPQDRLSHIIVSHGFEADDEFFYPNKTPTYITDRSGKTLNTQDAKIQLAEIPFVRLREGLPRDLLDGEASFVETVASVPKIAKTAQVQINLRDKLLVFNDISIAMSPIQFTWYSWLATRLKQHGHDVGAIRVHSDHHQDFLRFFESLYSANHTGVERARNTLENGFNVDYISEKNSLVNKRIKKALGSQHTQFLIKSSGRRPHTHYSLQLEPDNILIKDYFGKNS